MNQESLYISKFGPIENVALEGIKGVNVFIGESGSGKSTVMKVLGMCRWLYKMQCIRSYLKLSGIKSSPFRHRGEHMMAVNGLSVFLRPESKIRYAYGDFECGISDGKLKISKKILPLDQLSLEKIAYISDRRDVLPDIIAGNMVVKHGMLYLEDTLSNFQKALDLITDTSIPYIGVKMNVRKTTIGRRVFVSSMSDSNGFKNLPLSDASSGIKSTVGLHFIINYFAHRYDVVEAMNSTVLSYLASNDNLSRFKPQTDIGAFSSKRISLLIEEPELSLFPSNQRGLVNYIVSMINSSGPADINLTFATHSPYILTSLNVLMMAQKAKQIDSKMTEDVMGGNISLHSSKVSAWEIKDGCSRYLLDEETGLIDGSWLDSASDVFDDQIYRLNQIIYG
ncbi:MAG: AAA family ATPase [Clostridium sp.]|nr:AAA family ATPase [Clostridium sp.]